MKNIPSDLWPIKYQSMKQLNLLPEHHLPASFNHRQATFCVWQKRNWNTLSAIRGKKLTRGEIKLCALSSLFFCCSYNNYGSARSFLHAGYLRMRFCFSHLGCMPVRAAMLAPRGVNGPSCW